MSTAVSRSEGFREKIGDRVESPYAGLLERSSAKERSVGQRANRIEIGRNVSRIRASASSRGHITQAGLHWALRGRNLSGLSHWRASLAPCPVQTAWKLITPPLTFSTISSYESHGVSLPSPRHDGSASWRPRATSRGAVACDAVGSAPRARGRSRGYAPSADSRLVAECNRDVATGQDLESGARSAAGDETSHRSISSSTSGQ